MLEQLKRRAVQQVAAKFPMLNQGIKGIHWLSKNLPETQ